MPLTSKGRKIKASMVKQYGKKKGERVFFASERSGKIKGVAKGSSSYRKNREEAINKILKKGRY